MAYSNSIALAQKYVPILDGIYKDTSKFSILDTANSDVKFINANTVLLPKLEMDGLADYSRNGGFVNGAATLTWGTYTLRQDRGRDFVIDAMDDEETMNVAFGRLASEFIRTKVTPEIDAYTAAALAAKVPAANKVSATISTGAAAVAAVDDGTEALDNAEVPYEGRILFVSPAMYKALKSGITRMVMNRDDNVNYNVEMYNDMRVITVPQARFVTAIDLLDGTTSGEEAGGYAKASGAADIDFMIVHPTAVRKIAKHVVPRIFANGVWQKSDGAAFQYRIYHDVFVLDNKVNGLYMHTA